MMYVHYMARYSRPIIHPTTRPPAGATPWPSEMLPTATTATMGLRRRAGEDSPYHAREAPAFAEPCL